MNALIARRAENVNCVSLLSAAQLVLIDEDDERLAVSAWGGSLSDVTATGGLNY